MKTNDAVSKLLYADLKALVIGEEMYREIKPMMLDPIDLALEAFKKKGGKVTVVPYRKSRKAERLVRVGVKN